jgi:hypothetical protein
MRSFDVTYVVGDVGSTISEMGTMDCGGPTKHVLSTSWFDYFNNLSIHSMHNFGASLFDMRHKN